MRIVHELDGIAGQVQPAALFQAGSRLWEAWCRHPGSSVPDLLFGLDAGGIVPTVAVALASGLPSRLALLPVNLLFTGASGPDRFWISAILQAS